MTNIYVLVSKDLSGLGGPMGTERVTTNWRRYFRSKEAAKSVAEKDYGKPIRWRDIGTCFDSGDLAYVQYTITPIHLEDE